MCINPTSLSSSRPISKQSQAACWAHWALLLGAELPAFSSYFWVSIFPLESGFFGKTIPIFKLSLYRIDFFRAIFKTKTIWANLLKFLVRVKAYPTLHTLSKLQELYFSCSRINYVLSTAVLEKFCVDFLKWCCLFGPRDDILFRGLRLWNPAKSNDVRQYSSYRRLLYSVLTFLRSVQTCTVSALRILYIGN